MRCRSRATADRVELAVEDGGQGIADADSLLDRGSSAGGSTGLGLDIAASAAQAAGGSCASSAASRSVVLGSSSTSRERKRAALPARDGVG